MEYKEPKLESFQTIKKEPKMVRKKFEEMPEEIVEEFEEFLKKKKKNP
ncbi:MAG: hypothetical protein CM15mV85_360 [uncultured marine virus]|nr:MAG: hypothetical protein CM15mV85_360 [uncultured marine virus]